VIDELLPPGAVTAESFGDPGVASLFPGEAAVLATAGARRRAEFAAGRACARAALAKLGVRPAPLLPGGAGEPQWPGGVSGSLTHCAGYRACAAARAGAVAAIGIDAEPCRALPSGLLAVVATRPERSHLAGLPTGVPWDLLLFCAKEAVYKAWFPLTGRRLGFAGVSVVFTAGGSFTARLADDAGPPVAALAGRWLVRGGLAVTAATVMGS
jgi:4'-phosphopantetheinyl transferase EntD